MDNFVTTFLEAYGPKTGMGLLLFYQNNALILMLCLILRRISSHGKNNSHFYQKKFGSKRGLRTPFKSYTLIYPNDGYAIHGSIN